MTRWGVDEEQRVDCGKVCGSGTAVVANNEPGLFAQGIFLRGSQSDDLRVLPFLGGRVVFPDETLFEPSPPMGNKSMTVPCWSN